MKKVHDAAGQMHGPLSPTLCRRLCVLSMHKKGKERQNKSTCDAKNKDYEDL